MIKYTIYHNLYSIVMCKLYKFLKIIIITKS